MVGITSSITEKASPFNGSTFVMFDIMPDIDTAEQYKNQSVYIDKNEYKEFQDKVFLSELINKPVLNENAEEIGKMVNFDDYGATIILTIKCGAVSYSLPFVDEVIVYSAEKDAFVVNEQRFKDMRI